MILILIFAEALALYGLIGKILHLETIQAVFPLAEHNNVFTTTFLTCFVPAVGIILASKAGKSA